MSSQFWQVLRTIHIHLSLASFALLLFFGLTGVLLVHAERWGLDLARAEEHRGTLSEAERDGDRLVLVEAMRRAGAVGAVTDFDDQDGEVRVTFERPSQRCDARIDRGSGAFDLNVESRGAWALLLDLHTGKGGGDWWWVAIDLAGLLWLGVSATGLVLWMQLKKRRIVGLFWLVFGLAVGVLLVPLLAP